MDTDVSENGGYPMLQFLHKENDGKWGKPTLDVAGSDPPRL